MAPPSSNLDPDDAIFAAAMLVFALPELWFLIAEHSGLVGAWRLMLVCRAAREGSRGWLGTLPGLHPKP
jgi:hypothetical protein